MITYLRPYPAYKDSGVDWIGEVPARWEVRRLKHASEPPINGIWGKDPGGVNDIACVRVADFDRQRLIVRTPIQTTRAVTTPERGRRLLSRGDLLLEKSGGGEQQPVGVVVEYTWNRQAISSNFVARLRPRSGFIGRYLVYLHYALYARRINVRSIKQTTGIQNLDGDEYLGERVPLATTSEQAAIARFLDHIDSRIQRFITTQEQLIELLREEKQASIHRAITCGVDPSVSRRPSGVDWIGDIPEHWDVLPLGRCLRGIEQGWSPVAAEGDISPEQWTVLTLSAVRKGCFEPEAVKPISMEAVVPVGLSVRDGDLLMTRANTRDRVGDVCIVKGVKPRTIIPDLIYRLSVDSSRLDVLFLMTQLLSPVGRLQIERDARGSNDTMPKITQRRIRGWKIVVPPKSEQAEVAKAVEVEVAKANQATETASRQISLLREYRARLIFDVVTGKLDVREAARHLPDDLHADDPALDEQLEEVAAG